MLMYFNLLCEKLFGLEVNYFQKFVFCLLLKLFLVILLTGKGKRRIWMILSSTFGAVILLVLSTTLILWKKRQFRRKGSFLFVKCYVVLNV